jgi:Tol biopolymer transport system component
MRAVTVSVLVVAALAVGASMGGAAAAFHAAEKPMFRDAMAPAWSPDGKGIAFVYTWSVKEKNCCGQPPSFQVARYRIVRTSSKPGRSIRSVFSGEGRCCWGSWWPLNDQLLFATFNLGVRSVSPSGGESKSLDFPDCPYLSANEKCGGYGLILSPNRRYAAVTVTTAEPHTFPGIALVKLRRGRVPVVLPTSLTAAEDNGLGGSGVWDQLLAFSPDGTQVVFSRSQVESLDPSASGQPTLMAISVHDGEAQPLTQTAIPGASSIPNGVQQLQWSPDGRWIAFVENGLLGNRLEVVPTAGGSPRTLPGCGVGTEGWEFAWSPTSSSLAYDCSGYDGDAPAGSRWTWRFLTVTPDGTNPTDLLKGHRLAWATQPQWSPDGSRLLFEARRISHRPIGVWTIRPDGHDLTRIG